MYISLDFFFGASITKSCKTAPSTFPHLSISLHITTLEKQNRFPWKVIFCSWLTYVNTLQFWLKLEIPTCISTHRNDWLCWEVSCREFLFSGGYPHRGIPRKSSMMSSPSKTHQTPSPHKGHWLQITPSHWQTVKGQILESMTGLSCYAYIS